MKSTKIITLGSIIGLAAGIGIVSAISAPSYEKTITNNNNLETIYEASDDSGMAYPLPVIDHQKYQPKLGAGTLPVDQTKRMFTYDKAAKYTFSFKGLEDASNYAHVDPWDEAKLTAYDFAAGKKFGDVLKEITSKGAWIGGNSSDGLSAAYKRLGGWNSDQVDGHGDMGQKVKFVFENNEKPSQTEYFWLVKHSGKDRQFVDEDFSALAILPSSSSHMKSIYYKGNIVKVPTIFGVPVNWMELAGSDGGSKYSSGGWAHSNLYPNYISSHDDDGDDDGQPWAHIFSVFGNKANGVDWGLRNGGFLRWPNLSENKFENLVTNLEKKLNSSSDNHSIDYFKQYTISAPNFDPIIIDETILEGITLPSTKNIISSHVANLLKINKNPIDTSFKNDLTYGLSDISVSKDNILSFNLQKKLPPSWHAKNSQTDKLGYSIPLNIVNLEGIFTIDYSTSQMFDYSSGEKAYYKERPSLYLEWNEKYFNAVNAWVDSKDVLNQIKDLEYASINDKQLAIAATKESGKFIINKNNVQDFIENYKANKTLNINNLYQGGWYSFIQNGIVNERTRDFLPFLLNNSEMSLHIKVENHTQVITFKDLLNNMLEIKVPSTLVPNKIGNEWTVDISDLRIKALGNLLTPSIDLPVSYGDLKDLYKVDFNKVLNLGHVDVWRWKYYHQTKPTSIDEDITWIVSNTGVIMNDKFEIISDTHGNTITPPSRPNSSDYGWDAAYYHFNLETKKEDPEAKLWIWKDAGVWKTKIGETTKILSYFLSSQTHSASFDESQITYLFGSPLHLHVNPYKIVKTSGIVSTAKEYVDSGAAYGIKRVVDQTNNTLNVLEDWTDGKMNHLTDSEGIPKIDGIFGSDLNGWDTPEGIFLDGKHKVNVELFNDPKTFQSNFSFEIDTTTPSIDFSSSIGSVSEEKYHNIKGNYQGSYSSGDEVLTSTQPITLDFEDSNLKEIQAEIYDLHKKSITFNIPITEKKKDGELIRTAHFIVNYQGFISFKLTDWAGHTSTKNVYINQEGIDAGSEVILDNATNGERLKVLYKNPTSIKVDGEMAHGEMRIYQSNSASNHIFLDIDPTHANIKVSELNTGSDGASWSTINPRGETLTGEIITKTTGTKFGRVIPDTPNYDPHTGELIPVEASPNMGIELSPMLDNLGKIGGSPLDALSKYRPSSFVINTGIYKVEYDLLIGDQVSKKSYYVYIFNGDINSIDEPFPGKIVGGITHFAVNAEATSEVKDSRIEFFAKEKEAFVTLAKLNIAKLTLEKFLEANKEALDAGAQQAHNYRVSQEAELVTLRNEEVYTSVQNKIKDLEDEKLKESPDLAKINRLTSEINSDRLSQDFLDINDQIKTIEANLDAEEKYNNKKYKLLLDQKAELEAKVEQLEKDHERLLDEWENALQIVDPDTVTYYDEVRLASSDPIMNFLYNPSSIGHKGLAGYLSTHPTGLYSTGEETVGQRGWVDWRHLGSSLNSVMSRNDVLVVNQDPDNPGKYFFKYTTINPETNELEDTRFPLVSGKGTTYDGDNLVWNGFELEDFDHLVEKQKIFIEKDAGKTDPDKLFDLLEEFNKRLSSGEEIPLNPEAIPDNNLPDGSNRGIYTVENVHLLNPDFNRHKKPSKLLNAIDENIILPHSFNHYKKPGKLSNSPFLFPDSNHHKKSSKLLSVIDKKTNLKPNNNDHKKPSENNNINNSGLAPGAIAGIVIMVISLLSLIGYIIFRRLKTKTLN